MSLPLPFSLKKYQRKNRNVEKRVKTVENETKLSLYSEMSLNAGWQKYFKYTFNEPDMLIPHKETTCISHSAFGNFKIIQIYQK